MKADAARGAHRKLATLVTIVCLSVGCDALPRREAGPSPTPEPKAQRETGTATGRFQLLYAPATTGPLVLRMDTTTGETWRLDYAGGVKWTSVADHLQSIGTYNPATKQVEWGVRAPDGRDLSALSKEELLRFVSAVISDREHVWTTEEVKKLREQQSSADPLGLFTPEENAKRRAKPPGEQKVK